ncbi:response regulator transcription factor [Rhodobacter capsulatus]|uniref:response regulator transcription factor n=1 Tax=Rhodobacter capsulatus TaxID=1061 RepID=UPI0040275A70
MFDIAIVEDEELERRALRSILERNLPDVTVVGEAKNGAEAVRLIESRKIDLMLLDIRIPRPDGLEILELLRNRAAPTKVLIITAYDHFEIMQAAIQLRADGFLLKPVRTEALLKSVTDCLRTAVPVVQVASPPAPEASLDLRSEIGRTVAAHAYRDALALVRRQVETLHGSHDKPARQRVLDLARVLTDLIDCSGRSLPAALARRIEALSTQRLDPRDSYKLQELFAELTDQLFDPTEDPGVCASDRIETVRNYIERNLHKSVTLEDAAEHAHVSPCYLSRLFHRQMEMTFIAYVKLRRIERAKDLLTGSRLPIVNVALDLAYQDANYFCKAFKKEVGMSPSEYRRAGLPPAEIVTIPAAPGARH